MASTNTFALLSGILVPVTLAGATLILAGGGCGSTQACFHWTEAEGACPSREDAIDFFQDPFCTSEVTSVDSEGTFDVDVCCYAVTESDDRFGGSCTPGGFEPGPQTAVAVGVGGFGGVGGAGGMGGMGAGGNVNCSTCKQFMLETDPLPLCDTSLPLYQALSDCRCTDSGPCFQVCAASACMSQSPSMECEACMLDSTDGCGTEYLSCSQDE